MLSTRNGSVAGAQCESATESMQPTGSSDHGVRKRRLRRYADSVVAAETGKIALPKRGAFFGTRFPDDQATIRSADKLILPLYNHAELKKPAEWSNGFLKPEESTRKRLASLIGGEETPALLLAATHGMGYDLDSQRQRPYGGSLVCQDWPGSTYKGPVRDFFFSAEEIPDDANVAGMIALFFACYGAGTPQLNDFSAFDQLDRPNMIARQPFVGRLPQRLLAHPRGARWP